MKHRKIEAKQVDVYQTGNPECCPVRILNKYLGMLPKSRSCTALYLQPKCKFTATCWYLNKPVDENTLCNVIKELCSKASLPGYYPNHSFRATSATRMYQSDIEEQVIQEVTGHRSLSVRSYKRTSEAQCREANRCLFNRK